MPHRVRASMSAFFLARPKSAVSRPTGQLDVARPVHEHVLGLDVAVDDAVGVQVAHCQHQLGQEQPDHARLEAVQDHSAQEAQVPVGTELHEQVESLLRLEGVQALADERVVQSRHDVPLHARQVAQGLATDLALDVDHFDRQLPLSPRVQDAPDLAESADANGPLELKALELVAMLQEVRHERESELEVRVQKLAGNVSVACPFGWRFLGGTRRVDWRSLRLVFARVGCLCCLSTARDLLAVVLGLLDTLSVVALALENVPDAVEPRSQQQLAVAHDPAPEHGMVGCLRELREYRVSLRIRAQFEREKPVFVADRHVDVGPVEAQQILFQVVPTHVVPETVPVGVDQVEGLLGGRLHEQVEDLETLPLGGHHQRGLSLVVLGRR